MNIEQIQPESAAFEISRLLVADDDATATAALTALLHNVTGCDIPQTSDIPESEVEELVPLCVSILRRHWQTPLTCLGDGITPMSMSDLLRQSIGDRVNGNEAWSIPPVHANIPAALTALRERHIADGLTLTLSDGTTTQAPDGLSLAQLLCTSLADTITELKDDNVGWEMNKNLPWSTFANLSKVVINCVSTSALSVSDRNIDLELPVCKDIKAVNGAALIWNIDGKEEMEFPELEIITFGSNANALGSFNKCKVLRLQKLRKLKRIGNASVFNANPLLEEIYMPNFEGHSEGYGSWPSAFNNNPNLRKVVCGRLKYFANMSNTYGSMFSNCPNLVHLEIAEGTSSSLLLWAWNPTTALSERLPEFLSNFKTYIAHRLTDKGSGLTLTLSPAVRDAIQQDPEIVSIITSKGWTISPAPSV